MPLASIHPPPLLPGKWGGGGDQIYGVWNTMTQQHLRGLVHLPCLTHTPKAHIHAWAINPNRQRNLFPLERVVDLWDADVCLKHCSILRARVYPHCRHTLSLSLSQAFSTEALSWLISLMHSGRLPNQRASNTDKRALQCSVWWKTANLRFF